ncbi:MULTISPECIES: HNH endonuclease [unclassified Sinorhizobium]|uniref:HNH endonuclease n=1 Tax=unclassified Sinorhizobium TaxID=2613772 RepID=UPI003523555A
MRNLPLPSRDHVRQHLTTALEVYEWNDVAYGYPATDAEIDAVIALYDAYDLGGGSPDENLKGGDLNAALKSAIQSAYGFTQVSRKLASIRNDLMRGVEHCPICGISAPRQLDHYLPKATFQPLAVYTRNLVPTCGECNQSKSATVAAAAGQQFVHAYFEQLPQVDFLQASLTTDGGLVVNFHIDGNVGLPQLLHERLTFQLVRLHLNERYAREINTYLTGHTVALHLSFRLGANAGVRDFLIQQAQVEFARFHRNHWRPVLLRALAADHGFCNGDFMSILPTPAADLPMIETLVVGE